MEYILNSSLDEHLNDSLELHHSFCLYCYGYYGPCFGDVCCATCHVFMYSEDFEPFQAARSYSYTNEKDDGDSGNDEPSEEAGPSNTNRITLENPILLSPSPADEEPEVEIEPMSWEEAPGSRWPMGPQNKIASRLALLTSPRPPFESITTTEDMSLRIPPEIWATIFRKLDDVSLLMASKVSSKWKAIVLDQHPNCEWEEYVKLRWPLFHPIYSVLDWYTVYSDFMDSTPCKMCFMNLLIHLPAGEDVPALRSLRSVRLHKELKWLKMDHPEGIEAVPLDALNYNWLARINGPPQSPYQGGVFYLNLKVPHDYPLKPPVVRFLTRILHPNVSRHGDIGIDCIQHNWTLALTIPQILLSVQSLLTDPYLEINMEPSVADLYEKSRQTFDKIARIWTWKYAMHDVLVH